MGHRLLVLGASLPPAIGYFFSLQVTCVTEIRHFGRAHFFFRPFTFFYLIQIFQHSSAMVVKFLKKKKVRLICGDDGDAQKANQMHETCADADHEISRCQLLGALCLIECDWEPAHVVNMKTSQVSAGPPPQKPIRRPLSSAIKLNAAVSNVFIYQPASFFLGGRRRRRLICSWKSWHGRPLYPYKNI